MNSKNFKEKYSLSGSNIDQISDIIHEYLTTWETEPKNKLRIRLSVEEVLLRWRDFFGEEAELEFKIGTRLLKPYIAFELPGNLCDPLEVEHEDSLDWSNKLLVDMGLNPIYSYQRGRNVVVFNPQIKKSNLILQLFIALAVALVVGFLGMFLPDALRTGIATNFLSPIYSTFMGLITMVASPIIFLSVFIGICRIGNISIFGKVGKWLIIRLMLLTLAVVGSAGIVSLFFFGARFSTNSPNSQFFFGIFQMILDIFPDNVLGPLVTGNSMQIVILAVMCSIAALVLGSRMSGLLSLAEQSNYIVEILMDWLSRFVPLMICVDLIQNFWMGTLTDITKAWQPLFLVIGISFAFTLLHLLYTSYRLDINISLLMQKLRPAFMLELTTGSSSAAFSEIIDCCEKKLGVKKTLSRFGIPLGIVIVKPSLALEFFICSLFSAQLYNIEISAAWILLAVFSSWILSIATPPISGGALICFTVLFAQLGIPPQALIVVMTLDIILDFFGTAFDLTVAQNEVAITADKMHLMDRKILLNK